MIYLDYSATTPVNKEVLESFNNASIRYIGNPNSLHKLGVEANDIINQATKQIADLLGVKENEIIYTSGSSESNNLAIKGIASRYKNRGKHIITTQLEHSSVVAPFNYLANNDYDIDIVPLDENGIIDLNKLEELIKDDTILVSINMVDSETGITQPIDKIAEIIKKYPKCYFHVDMTQAIGKIKVSLKNVDLASFSAHKFYGLKGIGVLIKKEKIELTPQIHGGKSTTIYRSGTPSLPLIVSTAKALRLALNDLDLKYNKVLELNNYLKDSIKDITGLYINSNEYSIPHILNISLVGIKPETMLHALEEDDIYVSTKSACSSNNDISSIVLALTKDKKRATSSIRISISSLTTKEEIDILVKSIKKNVERLRIK